MLPAFLIPECELHEAGVGEVFAVPESARLLLLTLAITSVVEQESLDMMLYGSEDGVSWSIKPVLAFPQKFYPGTSQLLLDLNSHPGMQFLRPQWKLNRWGRGDLKPCFAVYLFAQEQRP